MEKIWQRYLKTRDQESLQDLVIHYLPLVKVVCGKFFFAGSGFDEDDLRQEGVIGLIQAIQNFDLSRNVKFETYATQRIRGCILDKLRKAYPQSRHYREQLKKVNQIIQALTLEKGREPEEAEVAEALGLELNQYHELLSKIQPAVIMSLESEREKSLSLKESIGFEGSQDPEQSVLELEKVEAFRKLFSNLHQKEKDVLTLYYYEEMTLKEIAKTLELSESRVSQLHAQAVLKLRRWSKHMLQENPLRRGD